MLVLDCLYLVVSPPCSSLLSFPWTSPHGWKRSFLILQTLPKTLGSALLLVWTLCPLPTPVLLPLCVCPPARWWDKTLSTERLFFWGVLGGCFYHLWWEQRCSLVGLSTNFSPFIKLNINLCHGCLQETLPWCPKGSSKFVLRWFKTALAIIIKKKKEKEPSPSWWFFYKGMPSTLQEASPLIKQKKGQLKPTWACPCSCWHHFK